MKRLFSLLTLLLAGLAAISAADEQQPAFPGAEGFGRYTTGGRGGTVYHVTTLADNTSKGSFRYACNQSGKRTIVFDVAGTIYLKSELRLKNGNVTIAGQTAPGQGVCIADYPFVISADNVILRYMHFRLGNQQVAHHEGDGLGGMDRKNIIVDHCTVSWSIDECLSVYGSHNITVQWCMVYQPLVNAGHSKGAHGYGGNWGGAGASYHHNLIAHAGSRTPRLGPRPGTQTDERMDLRNNVIYNWGGEGCYGGEGMNVNIVNNYYKPGPATLKLSTAKQQRIAAIGIRTSDYTNHNSASPNSWDVMWHVWGKYYVDGNVNTQHSNVTRDNWTYGIYNQINNSKVDNTFTQKTRDTLKIERPIDFVYVSSHTAEQAYQQVLDFAGACLMRDDLDALIVDDVRNGLASNTGSGCQPGMINNQNDTGGWPGLQGGTPMADADNDGMDDYWERQNGLNPANASDGRSVCADGYTNLEHYLNSLVQDITDAQNEGATVQGYLLDTQGNKVYVGSTPDAVTLLPALPHPGADRLYNLCGQAVSQPACQGLYIKNGKKLILR